MEIVKNKALDLSRACSTCPHWLPRENSHTLEKIGECRYGIPLVMMVPTVGPLGQPVISVQSHFPITVEACWCGNHPLRKRSH